MPAASGRPSIPAAVTIVVNGAARSASGGATIQTLLLELGLDAEAVAVERNRAIVRRSDWGGSVLENGDTIEIVHFVGGG